MEEKIAVIFPGVGYHVDKPLLYYAADLAVRNGYEVKCVDYGEIDKAGIREKILEVVEQVMERVEKQLLDIADNQYQEVLFISKSIGSAIACEYKKRYEISARHIIYTPIQETLSYSLKDSIVFHGTGDSWCNTKELQKIYASNKSELYLFEDANHSLEIKDTIRNIEYLKEIMETTEVFIRGGGIGYEHI